MWARAPEAPVAELPSAADPTEPRTRPSQSRPPPRGSIFAPAQPLRGDDDRFWQEGRAAPAACRAS